eukprot:276974_1
MTTFIKNDNSHHIYEFKECDNINDIYFLVPFGFQYNLVSIYAKPVDTDTFSLMKTFEIKTKSNKKNNELDYLLNVLKILNCKIKSSRLFWHQIGFTGEVIIQYLASGRALTALLMKQLLSMRSRLVNELGINELLPILTFQNLQIFNNKVIAFDDFDIIIFSEMVVACEQC